MNPFETPSEYRAAFDALLAGAPRQFRVYDHDLTVHEIEHSPRHDALRALCVAGSGHRIELLLDETQHVARDCPRLMQLVRDFGHVIEIRQADPGAPRPDQAFVLADRRGVLTRADKAALNGSFHPDDPASATPLQQRFEDMWQRAPASVSATTLGL